MFCFHIVVVVAVRPRDASHAPLFQEPIQSPGSAAVPVDNDDLVVLPLALIQHRFDSAQDLLRLGVVPGGNAMKIDGPTTPVGDLLGFLHEGTADHECKRLAVLILVWDLPS